MIDEIRLDGRLLKTGKYLKIERIPDFIIPKRKIKKIEIPGRSSPLLIDEKCYEDVKIRYKVFWKNPDKNLISGPLPPDVLSFFNFTDELLYETGYRKLTDSYHPGTYRKVFYEGPTDVENYFRKYGRCELEFTADAYTYYESDTVEINYPDTSVEIKKPSDVRGHFEGAETFISISFDNAFNNNLDLKINNEEFFIKELPYDYIIIDSESKRIYYPESYENQIDCSEYFTSVNFAFPELKREWNTVEISQNQNFNNMQISYNWRVI